MLRPTFCFSFLFSCALIFLYESAVGQDTLRIHIEKAASAGITDSPQIYNIEGTVTIPSETRKKGSYVVIIYTRSGEGGKVQLQMLGEEGEREPRTGELTFEKGSTSEWIIPIWLGTKEKYDPFYRVYAVIVNALDDDAAKRLIRLTHDRYTKFKEEVLDILRQEKFTPFNPLVWTDKKVVVVRSTTK